MSSEVTTVALYSAHRGKLINYAGRIVGDRSKAEDVVQEAFIRFDKVARNEFLIEPLAYLYKIVRNLSLDVKRQLLREQNRHSENEDFSIDTLAGRGRGFVSIGVHLSLCGRYRFNLSADRCQPFLYRL